MSEPFLGQIILFAGTFAPRGWALCDGQILPINSNQSLFSILGTQYGGDGRTSFALPGLRGRVPVGVGQGAGLSNRNIGQKGGVEGVALTEAQMPAHQHAEGASTLTAQLVAHTGSVADSSTPDPANVLSKLPQVNLYSSSDSNLQAIDGPTISSTVAPVGGSQSHENRQPLLALNYIIALVGLFPSRN
jgi:microcystin-dependent protein